MVGEDHRSGCHGSLPGRPPACTPIPDSPAPLLLLLTLDIKASGWASAPSFCFSLGSWPPSPSFGLPAGSCLGRGRVTAAQGRSCGANVGEPPFPCLQTQEAGHSSWRDS